MTDHPFSFLDDVPVPETAAEAPRSKRRKQTSFTDALQRLMTRHGYHAGSVEQSVAQTQFNRDTGKRELVGSSKRDLFGFADFVAIHRDRPGVLFVQVCATSDISKRVRSACTHDASELAANKRAGKRPQTNVNRVTVLTDLLLAGNRFVIIGFKKGSNGRWQETIIGVTLDVVRSVQAGEQPRVAKLPQVTL